MEQYPMSLLPGELVSDEVSIVTCESAFDTVGASSEQLVVSEDPCSAILCIDSAPHDLTLFAARQFARAGRRACQAPRLRQHTTGSKFTLAGQPKELGSTAGWSSLSFILGSTLNKLRVSPAHWR